jgi:hypothetical protein
MTKTIRGRAIAYSMFAAWLAVVLWTTWNHAVWRDEVRALSKALDGPNVFAMFKGLHTEGHPGLWYLLLRGAHAVAPWPQVLQLISLPVAAASALLLVRYSPFDWWVNGLLLAGNFFLFEYSVLARNYGISMLLLFLLAKLYPRYRMRGPVLGILLFLLANCNAQSVLLAGGFLLFWLVDLAGEEGAGRRQAIKVYAGNAAITAAGVTVCLLTILPAPHYVKPLQSPGNGIVPAEQNAASVPPAIAPAWKAVLLPGIAFCHLTNSSREAGSYMESIDFSGYGLLLSAILFGSTLGLLRVPGAFVAALATLLAFSLFFTLVYRGSYRQEALWLVFLIACYWIVKARPGSSPERGPARLRAFAGPAATAGWGLFLLLILLQAQIGVSHVYAAATDGPPFSCSRDLANLIKSRPDLHDAILLAEPDPLLEPMPFYVDNPTYYVRDRRFGSFSRIQGSLVQLTLDDLLATARELREQTNKPVLILMSHPLDPLSGEHIYQEAHHWEFIVTPQEIRDFAGATQQVESFPASLTDENFDLYLLK